ncbi:hypothetical protein DM02DRAFT_629971 [Periconia macrospinosa]|uniref:Uncharacterized protein n=1 Tax=Periconia macrospinosa TaxID=97972 RepID=A0A2V1DLS1_9PLEO|nr:hypothetical protein DM02DRAFT_629971 [Periconia macrospinosa]
MAELDRLKQLRIIKRERFKFKLDSLHAVSGLSQTETAIAQGENIKTLTEITVYSDFPLVFTAAFFSMDFVTSEYPWVFFFAVIILTTLINSMIAWKKWLWGVCLDGRNLLISAWERWDCRRMIERWKSKSKHFRSRGSSRNQHGDGTWFQKDDYFDKAGEVEADRVYGQ